MSFFLGPGGLIPSGFCSARGAPRPAGQVQQPETQEGPSFHSALLVSRYTISSGVHSKQGPGVQGTLARGGRYRAVFPEGAKRLGHGYCLHGSVGGSGQRRVSNLVGEGAQCKPLMVYPRYHKTRYTGGTMLLRSVPGLTTCPRTCCIHRCFGARSGPAARVPDRLSSRTVGPRTSSPTSRLLLPRSRLFLG